MMTQKKLTSMAMILFLSRSTREAISNLRRENKAGYLTVDEICPSHDLSRFILTSGHSQYSYMEKM